MKETSIFILMIVLFGLAGNATAVSPMPEELERTQTVCVIHTGYMPDREKEIPGEESSSILTFEASMPEKDVLEKVTKHLSDKLNERNIAEFKVECKFSKK